MINRIKTDKTNQIARLEITKDDLAGGFHTSQNSKGIHHRHINGIALQVDEKTKRVMLHAIDNQFASKWRST